MHIVTMPKIVLNATLVTPDPLAKCYDFILDGYLRMVECGMIESLSQQKVKVIKDPADHLKSLLFELNHVRVNPSVNNNIVLRKLSAAITRSGVSIDQAPCAQMLSMCYKPLGELSDIVRFYVKPNQQLVFLSQAFKPSLVH